MGLLASFGRIVACWEAAQVELHGFYSVQRSRDYILYSKRTSIFRALVVQALMPWPCVVITVLADIIPMRPPTEGNNATYPFIIRTLFIYWICTIAISL
ncbi:hypothetical protein PHYSODRAFT_490206 [Phytophthora sojae]|uniref:Uncharacterized protein n=1 Tax=Phytophthora sojae (strain P6497) TaxID=1094619 RepID=G4Z7R2_PHYSP|nr:hypothetical protein PHYSODRAFT_490206 [Phytophthora sojae]EGZ21816.1 hypothetical protein PHYSODRAFT_490206 [Phytophthora sojae]|eukprot:XP_009524533.1 hypothetical protein PHYSODRAFT_490206 [Phytophthora sojae]